MSEPIRYSVTQTALDVIRDLAEKIEQPRVIYTNDNITMTQEALQIMREASQEIQRELRQIDPERY